MILADKIIRLRKKEGWSQEELADKMDVSRQAVSKWESGQAVPDLDKIIKLSTLFGVTTDYLLKDEIDEIFEGELSDDDDVTPPKRVALDEAEAFLDHTKRFSLLVALGVFLCIISPITLIVLSGIADEVPNLGISESLAGVIGLGALFAFLLCAIPIFIVFGFKSEQYIFWNGKTPFELDYSVKSFIESKMEVLKKKRILFDTLGICICIISPIPLILSAFCDNDLLSILTVGVLLFLVGIGTFLLVSSELRYEGYDKILKGAALTRKKARRKDIKEAISTAYWGLVTATYLAASFSTNRWEITWIIFVFARVLFPPVMNIIYSLFDKK